MRQPEESAYNRRKLQEPGKREYDGSPKNRGFIQGVERQSDSYNRQPEERQQEQTVRPEQPGEFRGNPERKSRTCKLENAEPEENE